MLMCVLFMNTSSLYSQSIRGNIYEQDHEKQKHPLPGVNVYWSGTTEGTSSSNNGEFELGFHPSTNKLVISFIGYANDTIEVSGSDHKLEIVLTENPELGEVVIEGVQNGAYISKLKPIYTQHINSGELRKAACCNLSESFETNASVDVNYADAVSGAKRYLQPDHGRKYAQCKGFVLRLRPHIYSRSLDGIYSGIKRFGFSIKRI